MANRTFNDVPCSEVTSRIYGYWAYKAMLDAGRIIIPGLVEAANPNKIEQLIKVHESAAKIVLGTIELEPLTVSPNSRLRLTPGGIGPAMYEQFAEAQKQVGLQADCNPIRAVELMALGFHFDEANDGFKIGDLVTPELDRARIEVRNALTQNAPEYA